MAIDKITSPKTENQIASIINELIDTSANHDLNNLTIDGESRLHALKSYLDEGELLTDAEGFADVKECAYSTFDKSKFTVVGSPTITEGGIASGFSSNTNYILYEGNIESYTKLVIKGRQKITTDGGYFYWGNGSQNTLVYNSNTLAIAMRNNNNVYKAGQAFRLPYA